MPWQAQLSDESQYIGLIYSELVTPQELLEAFLAATALAKTSNRYRFLADCTLMEGGHSIVDLYGLISLFEATGISRDAREAILIPTLEASISDVTFYETACRNRGFNVRVFRNSEEAIEWLCK